VPLVGDEVDADLRFGVDLLGQAGHVEGAASDPSDVQGCRARLGVDDEVVGLEVFLIDGGHPAGVAAAQVGVQVLQVQSSVLLQRFVGDLEDSESQKFVG